MRDLLLALQELGGGVSQRWRSLVSLVWPFLIAFARRRAGEQEAGTRLLDTWRLRRS